MSEKPATPMPRPASLGSWLILLFSALLVVLAFDRMSSIGSIDFQDSVRKALDDPAFDSVSLSVSDVQNIVRVLCFVVASAGIAAVILALELRKGSRSARVVLSVLGPVLLIGGLAVSTVPGIAVAVGVVMLWLEPSRAWFDGRAPAPSAPVRPDTDPRPYGGPPRPTPPAAGGDGRPPESADGSVLQATYVPPYLAAPRPVDPAPAHRPSQVVAACVVTWVACAVVGVVALLTVLVMAVASDDVIDQVRPQLQDAGISDHELVVITVVGGSVIALWCLGAALLALGAFLGRGWASTALVVSAAISGLLCVFAPLNSVVPVVPLAACAVVAGLLLRTESRAWYAARR